MRTAVPGRDLTGVGVFVMLIAVLVFIVVLSTVDAVTSRRRHELTVCQQMAPDAQRACVEKVTP